MQPAEIRWWTPWTQAGRMAGSAKCCPAMCRRRICNHGELAGRERVCCCFGGPPKHRSAVWAVSETSPKIVLRWIYHKNILYADVFDGVRISFFNQLIKE